MVTRRFPATVSPAGGGAASLQSFAATVRALSNSGLSLEVDADTDNVLQKHGELNVALALPGQDKTYNIACVVRSRDAEADSVIYSCEFDWSATMDPLAVAEDLLEFTLDD